VLDECIYFIVIWNTSGLIKLKKYIDMNKINTIQFVRILTLCVQNPTWVFTNSLVSESLPVIKDCVIYWPVPCYRFGRAEGVRGGTDGDETADRGSPAKCRRCAEVD
jgi:hypothetical protein